MKKSALVLLTTVLVLGGCKQAPSFIGTWQVTGLSVPTLSNAQMSVVLNADKTTTSSITGSFSPPAAVATMLHISGAQNVSFDGQGTWASSDKTLTLTMNGINVKGLPAQVNDMIQAQLKGRGPQTKVLPYTWKSDDQFTVTEGNVTETFTRTKP